MNEKNYQGYQELELYKENILETINMKITGTILDVGCYTGKKTRYFNKKGRIVHGIDINNQALQTAMQKNPSITYYKHNMEKTPTKTKYDTITCFQTIEHIYDYHNFIKNMKNSLKPKGTLVIETPNATSIITRLRLLLGDTRNFTGNIDETHIRFFSKTILTKALEKQKLKVTELFAYNIRPQITWAEPLMPTTYKEVLIAIAKKEEKESEQKQT